MTIDVALFNVSKFKIVNPPFPVWIEASPSFDGGMEILINALVNDRDSGERITISFWRSICLSSIHGPDELYVFLQSSIHELFRHEADEMIVVDGKRIFDPHAPLR